MKWCILIALLLTACTTVTPVVVQDQQPSWDGEEQNSGVIGRLTDGCWVVTPHWRDRYNAMISAGYGTNFLPALTVDYGSKGVYTNGTYIFRAEALSRLRTMIRIRKSGM